MRLSTPNYWQKIGYEVSKVPGFDKAKFVPEIQEESLFFFIDLHVIQWIF